VRVETLVFLALFILAASPASARHAGDPLRPGFNFFSKEQDVQLGQENAREVRKHYDIVRDQFLQNYIRRIGDRLAAAPEARDGGFHFTFTLLNVPQVTPLRCPAVRCSSSPGFSR